MESTDNSNIDLKQFYKKFEESLLKFRPSKKRPVDMAYVNYMVHNFKKGKILDIGCGFGELINVLSEFGFETYGIVVSDYESKECGRKGLNIIRGDASFELPFRDDLFDYVISIDSIEHIYNWTLCLDETKRVLKPNGRLLIFTPNADVYHNTEKYKLRCDMLKNANVDDPHIKEFNITELEKELSKRGFKHIQLHNKKFYYPIYYLFAFLDRFVPKRRLPYIFVSAKIFK